MRVRWVRDPSDRSCRLDELADRHDWLTFFFAAFVIIIIHLSFQTMYNNYSVVRSIFFERENRLIKILRYYYVSAVKIQVPFFFKWRLIPFFYDF